MRCFITHPSNVFSQVKILDRQKSQRGIGMNPLFPLIDCRGFLPKMKKHVNEDSILQARSILKKRLNHGNWTKVCKNWVTKCFSFKKTLVQLPWFNLFKETFGLEWLSLHLPLLSFFPICRIRQKALERREETILVDRACRQETFVHEMVRPPFLTCCPSHIIYFKWFQLHNNYRMSDVTF